MTNDQPMWESTWRHDTPSPPYPGTHQNAPSSPPYLAPPVGYPPPAGSYPGPYHRHTSPKRFWYGIGAVLVVLGLVMVGSGAAAVVTTYKQQPGSADTFAAGTSTPVTLAGGERKIVFVTTTSGEHSTHCDASSRDPDSGIRIAAFTGSLSLGRWEAVFTLTAQHDGEYTLTCTGAPTDTFGIGGDASVATFLIGMLAIVAGGAFLLLGVVTLTIVALRRRHRAGPAQ